MIRRKRARSGPDGLPELMNATEHVVAELLKQMRALRLENARLNREVERLSHGWDQIRKAARSAPRRRRA